MKAVIIIISLIGWWALSIGGYFTFKDAAQNGYFKPEARYNGNTERWLKEARIASYCGFGLPLYFVSLIAFLQKKK